jgi:hypothetical protein
MNLYGYLGLVFVWIAGHYRAEIAIFWCSVITAVVFFIASVAKWLRGLVSIEDDDYD